MTRCVWICGIVLFLASSGIPAQDSSPGVVTTQSASIDEHSEELLFSGARGSWQRPDLVMQLLSDMRGESVADLGAGLGFFTYRLSNVVGVDGKVYAVEFEPTLIERLETFVAKLPRRNTVVIRGTASNPGLPEGELDMVLSVNTWHHVGNRNAMSQAVQQALKPSGRLVIIDWREGEISIAPPADHRLARKALIDEMKADGWTLTTDSRFLDYQYLLIFAPPSAG